MFFFVFFYKTSFIERNETCLEQSLHMKNQREFFPRLYATNSNETFSERMYKIQKSIDEACGVFQLRVVTDVLIQNSHG